MGDFVEKMEGVSLTPLKIIPNEKGNIMHALKRSESSFKDFGEVYFSFVNPGETKGWKKHRRMTLNVVVPLGEITFCIYDDRENSPTNGKFYLVQLSQTNYARLTLSPGLWMAFRGIGKEKNMLMNFADIEHDPAESINADLTTIPWR